MYSEFYHAAETQYYEYWCKLLKVEKCIVKSSYEYMYLRLNAENRVFFCYMNWARNVKLELISLRLGKFWH